MDYEIIYSKRKTLCLQVKQNGAVVVRAPFGTPRAKIEEFVLKHRDWVAKKVEIAKNKPTSIDMLDESEIKRLQGELKTVENEVARANGKLSNNGFLEKAPKALVDAEREKRDKYLDMREKLIKQIKELNG